MVWSMQGGVVVSVWETGEETRKIKRRITTVKAEGGEVTRGDGWAEQWNETGPETSNDGGNWGRELNDLLVLLLLDRRVRRGSVREGEGEREREKGRAILEGRREDDEIFLGRHTGRVKEWNSR